MSLVPVLSLLLGSPDAVAGPDLGVAASMAPVDKKTFGQPRQKGDNKPRRKPRKKKDPYRGPFKKAKYPTQEILRPLVLPKQAVEITLGGDYVSTGGDESVPLGVAANVGVGHIVEIGVNTAMTVVPDVAWSEAIGLRARMLVMDGRRLDFAPGLDVNIPVGGGPGVLVVDLGARHLFSGKVFLLFGHRAIPITLGASPSVALVGNVGLGVQATDTVAVILDTRAVQLSVGKGDAANDVTGIWETLALSGALQVTPARPVDLGLRAGVAANYAGGPANYNVGAYVAARF